MKTVYLIHGWGGNPHNCWFPWLKSNLENLGYKVSAFPMPNSNEPAIAEWVRTLHKKITSVEESILVGHSVGCQAILRYLASLDSTKQFEGVFLVAPWLRLTGLETSEEVQIAEPWIALPFDWKKAKARSKSFTALFSDNDPFVCVEDESIFEKMLKAKIFVEEKKGHFDDEAGIVKLPLLLDEIKKL